MTKPDYKYSVPLDRTLTSSSPEVHAVVEAIYEEIKHGLGKKLARNKQLYKDNLRVVLVNLYAAYIESDKLFVGYARNQKKYSAKLAKYNKNNVRFCLVNIVDLLGDAGYIADHKHGFYIKTTGRGRQARVRASRKLIELMNKSGVLQSHIECRRELIVLRAEKEKGHPRGQLLDYDETPEVAKMRANLCRINDLLLTADIRFELSPEERKTLVVQLNLKDSIYPSTRTSKVLYRVFNNGKFTNGGRFYGHWVQGMPKEFRKRILVNGNPVTEWDYSGQHIYFLYHLVGRTPPEGDMYEISGFDRDKDRSVIKKLLQALLNAAEEQDAINAVFRDIVFEAYFSKSPMAYTRAELVEMASALKEKHPDIRKRLGSGAGIQLQYLDSVLAERILLRLADKDIPAIPVHDSFLVEAQHSHALESAMREEYTKALKSAPEIKRAY